ncbi:MAG: shikimate kinase [Alkalinema sp. FL-bin-369]|nr:shikimate kinase [Leptolyngbyaceae cyanobacterium LF-bin-369]
MLPNLQGISLYLIGMMGSGKTTIGKLLADRFEYQFFDTDHLIEQITQQSVSEIFAESGESVFRQLETQVMSELSSYVRKMVATGGGIVMTPENWGHLRSGIIIWLDVPTEVLKSRLESDTTRPILQLSNVDLETKLEALFCDRLELYAQADLRIAIEHHDTPEIICDRILAALVVACEEKATETAKIRQLNDSTPFQTH